MYRKLVGKCKRAGLTITVAVRGLLLFSWSHIKSIVLIVILAHVTSVALAKPTNKRLAGAISNIVNFLLSEDALALPEDKLPPDPGPRGEATLRGIDSDNDGVRDDVERYIFFGYPEQKEVRTVLYGAAIQFQQGVTQSDQIDSAFNAATNLARYGECLDFMMGHQAGDVVADLRAEFLNTRERSLAYINYNDNLAGEIFLSRPISEWEAGCPQVESLRVSKTSGSLEKNPLLPRKFNNSFAQAPVDQICRQGVFVFFGNGVWNDKNGVETSRRLLARRTEARVKNTELEGMITYGSSFNPTEGAIADLLETFLQNGQTDISQFWRFWSGLDPLPDFLQDRLIEISQEMDADILRSNPAVRKHVDRYNSLLNEGNKVIVVPHSQGNLFANIAYLGIDANNLPGFGIVSVGNPDNMVAGGGPYTTLDEDLIIGAVFGSLPANVNNFFGVNLGDLSGHRFADSYMALGRPAETKILNDIVSQIGAVEFPDNGIETGIITATLTWGANRDMDLHTFEPNGTHVYYGNLDGQSGFLDVDDISSFGPEHYFVSCDSVETGTYRFGVNYFSGDTPETATLTLKAGDQLRSRSQVFTTPEGFSGDSNPATIFRLDVTDSQEEGFSFNIR